MKKLFLLSIGAALSLNAFAQRAAHLSAMQQGNINIHTSAGTTSRTTSVGSTDTLSNVGANDTAVLYYAGTTSADSGYVSGMDVYGDMGYAERFDFNGADSTLKVLGFITIFGGHVTGTTNTVSFYVWAAAPQSAWTGTPYFNSGLPGAVLDSDTNIFTNELGITAGSFSPYVNMFVTPTAYLNQSFFVGITLNYNASNFAGDTIGLAVTKYGERTSALYTVSGTDTIVNNQNVALYNDGSGWHDYAEDDFQLVTDMYLFPIVEVGTPLSVNGVTRNNLTFFGNYPNPAIDNTNIKISLANTDDVTITVMDMQGHMINTMKQVNLGAGEHIIPVNTSALAAGEYLYSASTASGAGFAGKLTIVK